MGTDANSQIKVRLDVSSLATSQPTGIGVYIENLVKELERLPDVDLHCTWYLDKFATRKNLPRNSCKKLQPYVRFFSGLNLGGFDIFHGPDFKVPPSRHYKKVVTIHDLGEFEASIVGRDVAERAMHNYKARVEREKPDHIIAVSHFTRGKILEYFPQYNERVTTVYLGADHTALWPRIVKRPFDFPYLLFIGSLDARKNIVRLIEAYEIVQAHVPGLHFVILGKNGYNAHLGLEKIASSKFKKTIHHLGYANDNECAAFYQHAEAFVFPSLYEGFGLPTIEAMAMGCPVITSSIGAMKEISGDAALHCDPFNARDIAEKIIALVSDDSLKKKLISQGLTHNKKFSWKRCAEETVAMYRQLSKGKS